MKQSSSLSLSFVWKIYRSSSVWRTLAINRFTFEMFRLQLHYLFSMHFDWITRNEMILGNHWNAQFLKYCAHAKYLRRFAVLIFIHMETNEMRRNIQMCLCFRLEIFHQINWMVVKMSVPFSTQHYDIWISKFSNHLGVRC